MILSSSRTIRRAVAFSRYVSTSVHAFARASAAAQSLLRHVAAVTMMMAFAGAASATIVTVTIQGTVGQDGVDQSSGLNGVFGPVGPLAGAPFNLTTTIDDTGGVPVVPDSANTSSISTHIATSVLTVNGVSVNMGALPSNTGSVVKSLSPALFDFLLSGSDPASSGSRESVVVNITMAAGNSPFAGNVSWYAPFSYGVLPNDQVTASFSYGRSGTTGTMIASGTLVPTSLTVSSSGSPSITPQVGLWWNPAESGSGYALDYKHGVLVVTVYSYTAAGAPLWYLASGPVTNNVFTSTLDKYQSGQCISCAYKPATINGNDGAIGITFSSPTSATMTLPGGRTIQIVPQDF